MWSSLSVYRLHTKQMFLDVIIHKTIPRKQNRKNNFLFLRIEPNLMSLIFYWTFRPSLSCYRLFQYSGFYTYMNPDLLLQFCYSCRLNVDLLQNICTAARSFLVYVHLSIGYLKSLPMFHHSFKHCRISLIKPQMSWVLCKIFLDSLACILHNVQIIYGLNSYVLVRFP